MPAGQTGIHNSAALTESPCTCLAYLRSSMSLIPFSCYNLVDRSFPRQTGASSSGEAVAQGSRVSQVGAIRTIPLFLFLLLLMCEELGIMGMGGAYAFFPSMLL